MVESITNTFGKYVGRLVFEPLPDGRRMKLFQEFAFIGVDNVEWYVPADAIVDGASIPQALWSITGGPFEGKYRDASVIHDYHCDVRKRSWRDVHRTFYSAMRVSGVSELRAKVMYAGVLFGGPRWSDTVIHNANLTVSDKRVPIKRYYRRFGGESKEQKAEKSRLVEKAVHNFELANTIEVGGLPIIDYAMETRWRRPSNADTEMNIAAVESAFRRRNSSLDDIDDLFGDLVDGLVPIDGKHERRITGASYLDSD